MNHAETHFWISYSLKKKKKNPAWSVRMSQLITDVIGSTASSPLYGAKDYLESTEKWRFTHRSDGSGPLCVLVQRAAVAWNHWVRRICVPAHLLKLLDKSQGCRGLPSCLSLISRCQPDGLAPSIMAAKQGKHLHICSVDMDFPFGFYTNTRKRQTTQSVCDWQSVMTCPVRPRSQSIFHGRLFVCVFVRRSLV